MAGVRSAHPMQRGGGTNDCNGHHIQPNAQAAVAERQAPSTGDATRPRSQQPKKLMTDRNDKPEAQGGAFPDATCSIQLSS